MAKEKPAKVKPPKQSGKGKGNAAADDSRAMRLSDHPRARSSIRRIKGGAGLVAFAIVALLSLRAKLPLPDAMLRALPSGIVAYFVAWSVAVTVWRQLALAEIEQARLKHEARRAALLGDD